MKTALLTYSHGNNIGNIHFLWKVTDLSEEEFSRCQGTIERAKSDIPVYHTRAMKQALFARFGRVTSSVKPAVLRALYKELTDDHSASSNLHEAEIDERMRVLLDSEDTDIVVDLRQLNTGKKGEYDAFWRVRLQAHTDSL